MTIRVSEVVTIDQIKQWEPNDIITIEAGTGAGKSYFIKNILYAHAQYHNKKILFLIHRTNCVNQFQAEIDKDNKSDTIHIRTYQSIEAQYKRNVPFDFSEYYYIVCDEFHYFISDAAFNITTDISLNAMLNQSEQIKIFMSATGNYMTKYISNYKQLQTKQYSIPIKFKFIRELTFYNKDSTLESFMNEAIEKQEKAIFFIYSAEKAYNLYQKYQDHALFNCSKNHKLYKHVDESKINQMLQEEKFDSLILITTTCMDAGVNIIDDDLKHIVCDVKDISTLIQCIGRKRLQTEKDHIYLYIKSITNQQLGGMETQLNRKIEKANFLRSHTVKEYIEKYPRQNDYSNIVYDDIVEDSDKGTKRVNELMYFKCMLDITEIHAMKAYGNFGYNSYLTIKIFDFNPEENHFYRTIEEDIEKMELINYLESVVGQRLLKDNQKELINKIHLKDSRGRVQKTYGLFNAYFVENKIPYMIISRRTSETREGKKKLVSYWEVLNNINLK